MMDHQRWMLGGALMVVAVGGAWAVLTSRQRAPAAGARPAAMDSAADMTGMAGMADANSTDREAVVLTADQIRQFGVTFGTADVRPLASETRTTGVVTFDETKLAQVALKFGGFVEQLHVNTTGQPVERGQPLLEIYSPDLVAAQQELLNAGQLQRDIGRSAVPGVAGSTLDLVEATKRRLRFWDISDAQIDELLRTGRVRRTLTVHAPTSGIVIERKVVQGQSVMPGEQLYTIAALSAVWVDLQLRERDGALVRTGSRATMEFAGLEGRTFTGRVEYVYPTLQEEARAVRARVVVANPGGALKPGMYATVRLTTPARTALTVPNSAVLRTGDRNVVFVDLGNGALTPREVQLGRVTGAYTEVLTGIKPGQRVVTSAQFLLDSEANLGDVMRVMVGQMSSGDLNKSQNMRDMPGMKMPPEPRR